MRTLWTGVDALLVPTSPTHPSFTQVEADPLGANTRLGLYTNFVNLLGWAALAVPAGRTPTGLPFGVTFIAPGGHDVRLLSLGRAWMPPLAAPAGLRTAAGPATAPTLPLAVVGAHFSGLPLNGQLTERGAVLLETTSTAPHYRAALPRRTTAPHYRFYALPGTTPPKPGLQRVAPGHTGDNAGGGMAIAVEVWAMPVDQIGSFLALITPPAGPALYPPKSLHIFSPPAYRG